MTTSSVEYLDFFMQRIPSVNSFSIVRSPSLLAVNETNVFAPMQERGFVRD